MARLLPEWAAANPVIMGLLEYVLEKRDRQILGGDEKPIAITLNPQNPPRALRAALSPFNDPSHDDGLLWDELKWLANEYRCFSIRPPGRRAAGRAPWEGARLDFKDASEPLVRDWLQRPRPVMVDPQWQLALARFEDRFENAGAFPPGGLELDPGFEDFEQLLGCWASVGEQLEYSGHLTWRQLSARCFLGDSKFLDSGWRQSLVSALFPSINNRIGERPLLMHLYLPGHTERVLLIENQDSFLWLADLEPAVTALVYIEGYRGGAARVRAPGIARFSTLNETRLEARRDFLQWWQGQASGDLPVYFWGDLDFEGMHIAAALRRSFADLDCWRPGYQPLLERLRSGGGHLPQQAGKERHKAIGSTGCAYADNCLIPALVDSGRSVDQEALTAGQLLAAVQDTGL